MRDLISSLDTSISAPHQKGYHHAQLDALADKTRLLSSMTFDSVQSDAVDSVWHEVHPSLLSAWDDLVSGHSSMTSDSGFAGGGGGVEGGFEWAGPSRTNSNSQIVQQENIESIIADIHSDPLLGSIHRKQMNGIPLQVAPSFIFGCNEPRNLAY